MYTPRQSVRSSLLPSPTEQSTINILLATNIAPDAATLEHLHKVATEAPRDLDRYDLEIEALRVEMERVSAQKIELESHLARCRSLLDCRIRLLPPELLMRILEICALSHVEMYNFVNQSPQAEWDRLAKSHVLCLAQVCKQWRELVFATPTLWSSIFVDTQYWPQSPSQHSDLLELSIARSKTRLLDVYIAAARVGDEVAEPLLRLAQESSRWRHVFLSISANSLKHFASAHGRLSAIDALDLATPGRADGRDYAGMFSVAPRLRRVAFAGHAANIPPELPWEQITSFSFYPDPSSLQMEMLPLHRLPAGASLLIESNLISVEQILFSRLHVGTTELKIHKLLLCVSFHGPRLPPGTSEIDAMVAVFRAFTLAKLVKFSLKPNQDNPASYPRWDSTEFANLALRSGFGSSLNHLVLVVKINDDELISALALLPNLAVLRIADSDDTQVVSASFLDAMSTSVDPNASVPRPLVPKLTTFHYAPRVLLEEPLLRMMTYRSLHRVDSSSPFVTMIACLPRVLPLDEGWVRGVDALVTQSNGDLRVDFTFYSAQNIHRWQLDFDNV
uniref:F-box domain-containing protein n=1 Tax=Mycena chlorophos TaxID=658473 RepID=A0ABQ0LVV6_MYCCL|nr:predicted protein [Mycena chlorophos]